MSHEIYTEDFEFEQRKTIFSAEDHRLNPLDDAEETDEACPECGELLSILTIQNGPDDFTEEYVCKNCGYREGV